MGYVQMGSYVFNVNGTTIAAIPYVPTSHVQPRQRHPVRATGDLKMPLAARCRQRRVHRVFPRHRQVSRDVNLVGHVAIGGSCVCTLRGVAVPLTCTRNAEEDNKAKKQVRSPVSCA